MYREREGNDYYIKHNRCEKCDGMGRDRAFAYYVSCSSCGGRGWNSEIVYFDRTRRYG